MEPTLDDMTWDAWAVYADWLEEDSQPESASTARYISGMLQTHPDRAATLKMFLKDPELLNGLLSLKQQGDESNGETSS